MATRRWLTKINLHEVLDNDDSTLLEKAQEIDFKMNQAVRRLPRVTGLASYDEDQLFLILDELADVAREGDVEAFDGVLESLYDWCDRERVWIGG